jgi:hypothetical protein
VDEGQSDLMSALTAARVLLSWGLKYAPKASRPIDGSTGLQHDKEYCEAGSCMILHGLCHSGMADLYIGYKDKCMHEKNKISISNTVPDRPRLVEVILITPPFWSNQNNNSIIVPKSSFD